MPASSFGTGGRLDRNSSTPLYIQLTTKLRERVEQGDWQPGQKIPSENELNRMFGISRMTVRQVLNQLVNEELLFRVQGKGTFVAHRKIVTRSPAYLGIREQLERQGYATTTSVLSSDLVAADARLAQHLHILPGSSVHQVRRIRHVDGEPVSLHNSFVPEHLAPNLADSDMADRQLCVILDQEYGLQISRVLESLESVLPAPEEAKLLRTRRGTPLLLLRQEIADTHGTIFEYSRILVRGDKIRLEFEYHLDSEPWPTLPPIRSPAGPPQRPPEP